MAAPIASRTPHFRASVPALTSLAVLRAHQARVAILTITRARWESPRMSPRRFVTGSLLSLVFSATAVAQTPAAPPTGAPAPGVRTAPLPRERGPIALGQDAFTVMHACQRAGWGFYARAAEDVKLRRGTRFALTTANVLPPDTDEARRYRLTFLDGKLIGLRDAGSAILLVSAELEEVTALADRLRVIREGKIVGDVDPKKTSTEDIGMLMTGG